MNIGYPGDGMKYPASVLRILHLNLKKKYWEEIKDEIKEFEFRLVNSYWQKRLEKNQFDKILIKLGYPQKDDKSRILERPYKGFSKIKIIHPAFGPEPVMVYAIKVN